MAHRATIFFSKHAPTRHTHDSRFHVQIQFSTRKSVCHFYGRSNATIISVRFKYKDTVKQEAVGIVQLSCSRDAGTGEKEFVERRVLKIPLRCHYDSLARRDLIRQYEVVCQNSRMYDREDRDELRWYSRDSRRNAEGIH